MMMMSLTMIMMMIMRTMVIMTVGNMQFGKSDSLISVTVMIRV